MNIVYVTTEAVPFAKTGGLADVCGTLPSKVAALGHRTAVIMPAFRSIHHAGLPIESTDITFAVPMSDQKLIGARLLKSTLPDQDVPVWFIDQPQYFERDSLYGTADGDYPDNAERFAFFCRAALQAIARLGWPIDIVHCNDWQTSLIPGLMAAKPKAYSWIASASTVLSIHNLAYQGHFWSEAFRWTDLDWSHFNPNEFEFYNHLNFLKTGIVTADMVSTVSPRYAEEIRSPEQGCGLDNILRGRSDRLVGIINGIDESVWDPETDPKIVANYDARSFQRGKFANKRSLQHRFGLEQSDEVPMIGLVGRLASQKGWDIILPVIRSHLSEDRPAQWIVLGSGDPVYEAELRTLAKAYPNRFALYLGFSDELAHQIEAGADLFLMPSQYEPCGLNQLYSLRYGTVPIVTETGGLANTVVNCTTQTLADATATGFYVPESNPIALDQTIGKALHLRYHQREKWEQIIQTGMKQDFSWRKSAGQYVDLYAKTIALKA
ncbi:glycogen synthase GlgA [Novipirellula artificiosorum]|uniref:Glycogen synthase n=1 Tax=Novipirellula artificiosorum TaxID=2528016 RepID=A0A5C6DLB7_9BACT|nr:glycogen synthase GlgA [Novipirellula artificiosorum]TWU37402.1 Glycogen synthase [Novipirellula artificiosorum]